MNQMQMMKQMQGRDRVTEVENRLVDTVGEGAGGMSLEYHCYIHTFVV